MISDDYLSPLILSQQKLLGYKQINNLVPEEITFCCFVVGKTFLCNLERGNFFVSSKKRQSSIVLLNLLSNLCFPLNLKIYELFTTFEKPPHLKFRYFLCSVTDAKACQSETQKETHDIVMRTATFRKPSRPKK